MDIAEVKIVKCFRLLQWQPTHLKMCINNNFFLAISQMVEHFTYSINLVDAHVFRIDEIDEPIGIRIDLE
jgi:hypothetical protein